MRDRLGFLIATGVLACLLVLSSAQAQDSAGPAKDRKADATAEIDLLKARIDAFSAAARLSPVEGKTTVTNVSIEAEVLAQTALTKIADQIVSKLNVEQITRLII